MEDSHQVGTRRSLCLGLNGAYSIPLHVGAIFIVLGVSIFGTALPIITKFVPFLKRNPFIFVLAKTAATGVLLSVSTIHLINESVQSFNEPCIPTNFSRAYTGYAFLFAVFAALLMHLIDTILAEVAEGWMRRKKAEEAAAETLQSANDGLHHRHKSHEEDMEEQLRIPGGAGDASLHRNSSSTGEEGEGVKRCRVTSGVLEADQSASGFMDLGKKTGASTKAFTDLDRVDATAMEDCPCDAHRTIDVAAASHALTEEVNFNGDSSDDMQNGDNGAAAAADGKPHKHLGHHHDDDEDSHEHMHLPGCGHSHELVLPEEMGQLRRVIAAICMEFGITLHSLFVGIDIGLTTDRDLKPLLVALVFHQLFEGMSMGSRLVDARFRLALDFTLTMVFSFSAPIGMSAATIAVSVNPNSMSGGGFVMMMGILDGFCGGILLYLAFNLLFIDFTGEMKAHCAPGSPHATGKKVGMFVALWIGMGLMALVGKWL